MPAVPSETPLPEAQPALALIGGVAPGFGEQTTEVVAPVAESAARTWDGPLRGDLDRLRSAVGRSASRAFAAPVGRSALAAARRAAPLGTPRRAHTLGTGVAVAAGTAESAGALLALAEAGAAAPLAPPTAAAAATVAVLAQLAQFYLVCGVIGHEASERCKTLERELVLQVLVETYGGRGASGRAAGERAARLVAEQMAARVSANLFPLMSVARGAYTANRDLRAARRAVRRA